MPVFEKEILPAGKYLVSRKDGTRVTQEFTVSDLREISDNTNKMIESGLRIPAPFGHKEEALPSADLASDDSYQNAGYWTSLSFKNGSLWGKIDAPGDPENMETPAGKLKNTIKEVSACIANSWKDGLGRAWGKCMLHGAPVIHPVVPGQTEFSLAADTVALSMSGMLSTDISNISELSEALKDSVNIHLPPATSAENLVHVLLVALRQNKLCKEGIEGDQEIVEPTSVFMSISQEHKMPVTKEQADYIVNLGLIDPNTKNPVTLADLDVEDPQPSPREKNLEAYSLAITKAHTNDKKSNLRGKVAQLVKSGKTTQKFAEENIYPQVDAIQLSIGEGGEFAKAPIELFIENLEVMPSGTSSNPQPSLLSTGLPSGMNIHEGMPEEEGELSKEDGDALVAEMLSMM